MRTLVVTLFLSLAVCTLPSLALADVLDGQSGTLYYDFPEMGTQFTSNSFTVPATVITLTYGPDLSNAIGGNEIDITFASDDSQFSFGDFNGEVFNFPGLSITSVVYSSNFTSDWGFDANDVWVNWEGLTPAANSFVEFQLRSVPEPGTLALLGLGLAAGVLRRRRSAWFAHRPVGKVS